jgi:propanol-preferring alcohol dehydrogenase
VASMPAYRVLAPGDAPVWCDVEIPVPRAGEVLIRMGGAGLCGTDLELLAGGSVLPFSRPFTLGHENAGWVERLGKDVSDLRIGEGVVVSTIRSCGLCRACLHGLDNFCRSGSSRGLLEDGGIAPFMIADRRQLVRLGDLSPLQAAPLADAGLTAYRAAASLHELLDGSPRVAVIGVGGLGALAVQCLRVLAPGASIVALDVDAARAEQARALGADAACAVDDAMTPHDRSAPAWGDVTAVIDFVGTDATLDWAARVVRPPGAIVICGRGGGVLRFSRELVRPGVDVRSSRGGTIDDLATAVTLVRRGAVTLRVTPYPFRDVARAYADLRSGRLSGRAVLQFTEQGGPLPDKTREK